jgi:tetratricopeptide (TPR) repeat protein
MTALEEAMATEQHSRGESQAKWDDYLGPGLAGLTAVLAVVVIGAHVYLAGTGKVDAISTLLLNILALTFSTVCTVWVGRWSALRENRAFIRAALRTTYGLHEGLQVAEQAAIDGIGRMKPRANLDGNISSQFWEEIVGRVVDQVRALMRRAQETVANWKEFGPEEVEQLSHAEETKATALTEVAAATEQVRGMLNNLKESLGAPQAERLQVRIEALEQEKARITASSALGLPATGEARKLLAVGAFEEAIAAYSSLIAVSPEGHSLYIARARARYLADDKAGALADLDYAEKLCPTDTVISRMREEINEGRRPSPVSVPAEPAWRDDVYRANRSLQLGQGEDALQHFEAAEREGLFPVFAAENAAMALLLLGRNDDARTRIHSVMPSMTGLFVRTQAFALLALADALQGIQATEAFTKLEDCLRELHRMGSRFDLTQSPLQHLFQGLMRMGKMSERVEKVHQAIQQAAIGSGGLTTASS